MDVSKSIGVVLLAGAIGMLLGGRIEAQNPASGSGSTEAPLPKDIYPDSRNRLPLPLPKSEYQKARLPVGIEQPSVRGWDPELTKLLTNAGLKYEVELTDRLLEIAVLVAAREMDCQYEWTQWETHGRAPNDPRHIEDSLIDLMKYEKPVTGLGEKEAAIITFGRETFGRRRVTPETFANMLRIFGRKGTVDMLWLMAAYASDFAEMTAFNNQLRADQKPLMPPATHPRDPARFLAAAASPLPKDVYPDSRNRLPIPKREDMDDFGKTAFDEVTRGLAKPDGTVAAGLLPTGSVRPSLRLWDPKLAKSLEETSHYRKYEMELPPRLFAIAVLVTAYELECQYEWTQWERFARNPNDPRHLELSTVDTIKYNKPVTGLPEKDAAIIKFGRETFGDRKLSSETFAEVLRLFGPKGTVDLLEMMGGYSADAAELTAFDQQLQVGQLPLLPAR